MGSILGGIFGGGSSPGQDAQMQGLHAARADIQKYRPEAMQAALNAMSNASTGYQGANNALQTLWGPHSESQSFGQKMHGSYGPTPERAMGHDMPQPEPEPVQGRPTGGQGPNPVMSFLDPAGIFGRLF